MEFKVGDYIAIESKYRTTITKIESINKKDGSYKSLGYTFSKKTLIAKGTLNSWGGKVTMRKATDEEIKNSKIW